MPSWHSTFGRMRGLNGERSWWTWNEFAQRLDALGITMSRYHVAQALKVDPPVSRRGWKQYDERHAALAVAYARKRGWIE